MTKLPKKTPLSIIEWVNDIERYHSAGLLRALPFNASLDEIKEAYDNDRTTLLGIGETMAGLCQNSVIDDE